MKIATRITALILICLFVIPLAGISAQEDVSGFSDELSGFIVQPAFSGEFVDNGDDTYTLSLESAVEFNSWIVMLPEFFSANHSLAEFAGDWSFSDEMAAEAVLQLGDMSITLTLSTPVYYLVDGTFSYTVVVEEIVSDTVAKGGPSLPETFANATLIIQLDAQFATDYMAARQGRLLETRPDVQNACAPWPSPC
jgi:hypothetical protein